MKLKLWFGQPGWGWWLYGVSYGTKWFFGLSISQKKEVKNAEAKD